MLLIILATVTQQMFLDKADLNWTKNFYVALYPINADASAEVGAYIQTLTRADYEPMAEYFAQEGARYNLGLRRPIELQLGAEVKEIPLAPPVAGNVLDTIIWSLKFRFFAWQNSPKVNVAPDIKLYLLYHNPSTHPVLSHSTALDKGRIGRVNLFGERAYAKQNLVITAHELLHTLSATDKYDLVDNQPIFPNGFADPDQNPLYPQLKAELMAGRIPIAQTKAVIPIDLSYTIIGQQTATEIGWLKPLSLK